MAEPMHDCEPLTLAEFSSAPVYLVNEAKTTATPDEVFRSLKDPQSWSRWAPAITNVTWTSPEPFGVGTTRTVEMIQGMVGEEVFVAWEDARRMAFIFTRANMPARAFGEEWTVEPLPGGGSRVRWAMAMVPEGSSNAIMKVFGPILGAVNGWMLRRMARDCDRHYAGRGG